jgi:hypothetical protein
MREVRRCRKKQRERETNVSQLLVALSLVDGSEGVDLRELVPAEGHETGRAVELHRAGTEGAARVILVSYKYWRNGKRKSRTSVRERATNPWTEDRACSG